MAAATKLSRTMATNDSGKVTISAWVKRAKVDSEQVICAAQYDGTYNAWLYFNADGTLGFYDYRTSYIMRYVTNRKFRDVGAWYHIVANYDNTLATPVVKLFVNGIQETSFSTSTNYSQDVDQSWTQNYPFYIGGPSGSEYFDGIMSHFYFIQGYVYDASTFGETDATSGIWKIKATPTINYTGTGTNSCLLKFEDSSNMDLDSGGNTLTDFATTGTLTATKDSPSNNFCTMNPLQNFYFQGTYSNGNNTVVTSEKAWNSTTMGVTTGKWYWETKLVARTGGVDWDIGFSGNNPAATTDDGGATNGAYTYYYRVANGAIWNEGSTSLTVATADTGDIIGIAIDLDNMAWYASKNGVWQNSGVPTSGASKTGACGTPMAVTSTTNGVFLPLGTYLDASTTGTFSTNFGNGYFGTTVVASTNADDAGIGSFEYDVPAGFYAICTKNLATYG